MEIQVMHRGFEGRNLLVRTSSLLSSTTLYVDGARVKIKRQRCTLKNNEGQEVEVKLRYKLFDSIPRLQIGGEEIQLAEPLKWHEHIWSYVPLALFLVGGALGAVI